MAARRAPVQTGVRHPPPISGRSAGGFETVGTPPRWVINRQKSMLYPISGGESTMALTRWSPFATLPGLLSGWETFPATTFRAPLDVQRTESGYRLQSALPGFKPEDVDVTLEQGTLTITARRSDDKQSE